MKLQLFHFVNEVLLRFIDWVFAHIYSNKPKQLEINYTNEILVKLK